MQTFIKEGIMAAVGVRASGYSKCFIICPKTAQRETCTNSTCKKVHSLLELGRIQPSRVHPDYKKAMCVMGDKCGFRKRFACNFAHSKAVQDLANRAGSSTDVKLSVIKSALKKVHDEMDRDGTPVRDLSGRVQTSLDVGRGSGRGFSSSHWKNTRTASPKKNSSPRDLSSVRRRGSPNFSPPRMSPPHSLNDQRSPNKSPVTMRSPALSVHRASPISTVSGLAARRIAIVGQTAFMQSPDARHALRNKEVTGRFTRVLDVATTLSREESGVEFYPLYIDPKGIWK